MTVQRLAISTLVLSFALILLGGFVHSTGSSLACPDWPLCYGQIMPEMTGGVAIEHSHRLLGATVGLLTILTCVMAYRRRKHDPVVFRLSVIAVALVIFQGTLGGLTVIYLLPTALSTAHLATAMLFLSTILWIALRSHRGPSKHSESIGSWKPDRLILLTALIIYMQIVLGALVRHTGAAIVCPDIPFCLGHPWPLDLHPTTRLHMLHRYVAIGVAGLVLFAGGRIRKQHYNDRPIRSLAMLGIGLVCLQFGLGIASVLTDLSLVAVTAHLGMGALLLLTFVATLFFMGHLQHEST